jgi:preprotein translocase subunit SecF
MNFGKAARLGVAVIVTMLMAEVAPGVVNGVLVLVLVGLILGHYSSFSFMADWLGKLSGDEAVSKSKKQGG